MLTTNFAIAERHSTLAKYDIVRLFNGHEFIITGISHNRPSNPYSGVKVNGQGAEYKFGPRYRPVKIGVASPDHPALRARDGRLAERAGVTQPSQDYKAIVVKLLDALDKGQIESAKTYGKILRELG